MLFVSDWLKKLSDIGHCLHSKFQITATISFVIISTDGNYLALKTLNVRYLAFNEHLKFYKINNLKNLTINDKISEKANYLHHMSANSHTCRSDARTFVRSMNSLEIIFAVCYNFGFLRFSCPKFGSEQTFGPNL